jgi:hypothetical protein
MDFELLGLKMHLMSGWCQTFELLGDSKPKQEPVDRPLSAAEPEAMERYFADLTCQECHWNKAVHRPGCSQGRTKGDET